MLRTASVIPAGHYDPKVAADTVVLDFEDRRRRRLSMTGEKGTAFLVDLAETPALSAGDGFVLEDGRIITVAAKPERLVEFRIKDPAVLPRIAWHLGNRHTPTQIGPGILRIRDDYVLVEMVKRLGGAEIAFVEAPFEPEGGAYGHGATMGHDHHDHDHGHGHAHDHHEHGHDHHDHDHGDAHAHDHDHDHDHDAGDVDADLLAAAQARRARRLAERAAHEHVHGPDCGCGHDHDHDHGHDHHHHDHDHAHEAHAHDHGHDHHDHDHAHGEACSCGHDHHHGHKHA